MVRCVPVKGYFAENCFFYVDDVSRRGFVIDPGAEGQRLLALIHREAWIIEAILLTHGHFDHTGAVNELRNTLHIPVYAHENADRYLMDGEMNLSSSCIGERVVRDVKSLHDGETVSLRDRACALRVLHTPGHTTDSVVYFSEKDHVAFVGDTIFKGSIGNYQYPGGNRQDLIKSITGKIFTDPQSSFKELKTGGIIVFEHDHKLLRIAACGDDTVIIYEKSCTVPEDSFFVLGDNTDNSLDSRYWSDPFVPLKDVAARIFA